MKKVLFIAYLYPPIVDSGTQRSIKFANYLPDYGWKPIVLTVENPPERTFDLSSMHEIVDGTRVERVALWSDVIARKIANFFRVKTLKQRVVEGISWRIRAIWNIPEYSSATWRPTAVKRALEIFRDEGYDCIYASGCPWTSFLIARDVSKKTGIPYVLDYRDLWTSWESPWETRTRLYRLLAPRQEKSVLKAASAIITVSNTLARVLTDMLPSTSYASVTCITNGYDPNDYMVEPASKYVPEKVRIVFTGVWKNGYSPSPLYEALKIIRQKSPEAWNQLEVVCAGFTPGPASQYGLEGTVWELGRVPHQEAIALMKSADVLFLPVAEGDYALGSLPGKFFEYLGSVKPIIAAVPDESEVALALSRVGGASRLDPDDVKGLAKVLVEIAHTRGPTWGTPDPLLTARFQRRNLAAQLSDVLFSVIEK